MKLLLVNADDFGMTPGVCRGIIRAVRQGIVRSTTAMVCVEDKGAAVAEFAPQLEGRVGLHLQLTSGTPVLDPEQVPGLVTEEGRFPDHRNQLGSFVFEEVLAEWRAQAKRLRSLGVEPTHLDSHHHVHCRLDTFKAYRTLAAELGIPARSRYEEARAALVKHNIPTADAFIDDWYGMDLTPEGLVAKVNEAFRKLGGAGIVELMCHPGEGDAGLEQTSSYVREREVELDALTSGDTLKLLEKNGVVLAGMEVFQ